MLSATTKLPGISRVFLRSIAARSVQTQAAFKELDPQEDFQPSENIDLTPSKNTCYSGKNILLTGSAGFCAKPLIERLLTSHPDVQGIYWLTNPSSDIHPRELLTNMFNDPLFHSYKANHGQKTLSHKVHTMHGDISQANFGLNDSDVQILEETINVVLHSNATGNSGDSEEDFNLTDIGIW